MCCVLLSLTVVVVVLQMTSVENITMIDTPITAHIVLTTLAIGWAAFGLSLVLKILYYALHPSQVTIKISGMFDHMLTL